MWTSLRCTTTFVLLVFAVVMSQQFGHSTKKHFLLENGFTNLNAAAFGNVCNDSANAQSRYYKIMESNPNTWFRGVYQAVLNDARTRIARYISATEDNLVIVENASSAINAVMRSLANGLNLGKGDAVLYMNIAYPMVKNIINYLAKVRGFDVIIVDVKFPITKDEDFIEPVRTAIANYSGRVRVAALDHMSSYPSSILPIKKLIDMCHAHDIPVMVDGAQVMGQIPLALDDLGADFYTANAHKWMYSPKGTAFLYVDKKWQHMIQPIVISSEYGDDFVTNFQYVGTRDYCPYMAIHEAMDFRRDLGDEQIMTYVHDLAWKAANLVATKWYTTLMVPEESMNGAIISVVIPCNIERGQDIQKKLFERYNTYVQLGSLDGIAYVRLCSQIYLELSDFELFADRFLLLLKE
jgi:selenocysteine lyase/cysteine desulfurase